MNVPGADFWYTETIMLLPLVAALLGILAFLPFPLFYWFGFLFLAPLFVWYTKERSLRKLIVGTIMFRLIFAMGTTYYTLEPIAWGISLLIFCGLPLSIWALTLAYKTITTRTMPAWLLLASMPIVWTIWDSLAARYSPLPTTIISAGNVVGSSPFVGLAAIAGITGLTIFIASINALIATTMLHIGDKRRIKKHAIAYAMPCIGIIVVIAFALAISTAIIDRKSAEYRQRKEYITITTVSVAKSITPTQHAALSDAIAHTSADLVVFPEGFFNKPNRAPYQTAAEMTATMTRLLPSDLAAGAGVFDFKAGNMDGKTGTAILATKNGTIQGTHNKARLSFAGEYWPFGAWHPSLYDWVKTQNHDIDAYAMFGKQNGYKKGSLNTIRAVIGGRPTTLAVVVCMELQYPSDIAWYGAQGAQFIANPTSNRWLTAGKDHFLFLANNLRRIESIHTNMPIIISGIEDIGGVFTPDGRKQAVYYEQTTNGYAILSATINLK